MKYTHSIFVFLLAAMIACTTLSGCSPKVPVQEEAVSASEAGAYSYDSAVAGILSDEAQTAFDEAMKSYTGISLDPIALIGTQIVSGTNYAILCKGTRVVKDPVPMLMIAIIYQDPSGNASVRNVADFDLTTLLDAADGSIPASDDIAGGWAVPEATAVSLSDELQTVFDKSMEGFTGASYCPLAYLGSQVVAGRNHVFVCSSSLVTKDPLSMVSLVQIYEDLDGNCTVSAIAPINVADYNQ